jgi:signal transduction histidine kinase
MNRLILAEARKLSRLSTDLLDLAKASYDTSGITFRELRLDEVLLDARKGILRANPDYRIDLQFGTDIEEGDPIAIRGNEYLLKVAFANLMENACKFSAARQCLVTIHLQQNRPVIAFRDEGIGIPGSDLPHIFTPFYRGVNKTFAAGNGIGLSLTARIVQLHSGTLEVRSPKGLGTTFTIRLPYS